MSFIKQHIALIFVILVCVVCTIESHDRGGSSSGGGSGSSGRRRGDKGSGIGSGGGGSGSASLVTGLCEKDADMKIACHCTHDHYRQRINEVDCLILHKELSHTDPAWRAFNTHTNIKNLMLTVTRNGYMGYLPISLFRNQRELNSVIIHFGNIREIPAFAFGNQTKLQNISLEKNQIEVLNEYAFANLIELNVLNLDDNQIVNISQFAFANLTALTELVLSKNNLTALHNELFTDMVNLRILKLNDNQLTLLGRDIFKGLGKLQQLDLSYNALKNLGDAVFTELWSLQELYLDSNNLERISERAFDGLNNLRILNLENNKITMLEGATFSGVPAVTTLNLNKNLLETLTYQNVLPIMDNLVNNTESVLSISENHFICECRLRWIYDLRNHTKNAQLRDSLESLACTLERPNHDLNDPRYHFNYKISSRHSPLDFDYGANDLNINNNVQNSMNVRPKVLKEVVQLFTIDQNHLPCEQVAEPTELPLQRESVGMDFGSIFKSSASSTGQLVGGRLLAMIALPVLAIVIVS